MSDTINEIYEVINLEDLPRASIFEHFKGAPPYISISMRFNITNFKKKVKERGWSFTYAYDYLMAKTLFDIPEFRLRILRSGEIRRYNEFSVSISVLNPKTQLVRNNVIPVTDTIEEFMDIAMKQQKEIFEENSDLNVQQKANMVTMSSLPWIPFESATQQFTPSINGSQFVIFGKFIEENGKIMVPTQISADHRFVDGFHMGMWYENLQKALDEFE